MVCGNNKSRNLRRIHKKVTISNKIIHNPKKPNKSTCNNCGVILNGISPQRNKNLSKSSKSSKRPNRMFGGNLCAKCLKDLLVLEARNN